MKNNLLTLENRILWNKGIILKVLPKMKPQFLKMKTSKKKNKPFTFQNNLKQPTIDLQNNKQVLPRLLPLEVSTHSISWEFHNHQLQHQPLQ